jgi:hypothetical protein
MFERLKSLFAAKPPAEFQHPEFGKLVNDAGVWSGQARQRDRVVRFYVGGTDTVPDAELINRVRAFVGRLDEVESKALDFIRKESPELSVGKFSLYSLDFLWEDKPDVYALEFSLDGDDDGIWRVEFEGEQPKFVGRDD